MNPAWGRALTIEQALFFAQECQCFYCGGTFAGPHSKRNRKNCWTRDHLLPAAQGHGRARNMVLACGLCNAQKGARVATSQELAKASIIHMHALRLMEIFNGDKPPEWTGDRAPTPTQRAIDIAERRS